MNFCLSTSFGTKTIVLPTCCLLPVTTLPKHSCVLDLGLELLQLYDSIRLELPWVRVLVFDETLLKTSIWFPLLISLWDGFQDMTQMLDPLTHLAIDMKVQTKDPRLQDMVKQWMPRPEAMSHYKQMLTHFESYFRSTVIDKAIDTKTCFFDNVMARVTATLKYHQKQNRVWTWSKEELDDANSLRVHETGGNGDCLYYAISTALHVVFQYGGQKRVSSTDIMMRFRGECAALLTDQRITTICNTLHTSFSSQQDYHLTSIVPASVRKEIFAKRGAWGDDAFLPLIVHHPLCAFHRIGFIVLSETEFSKALTLHCIPCSLGKWHETSGYILLYKSAGHYQLISCDYRLIVTQDDTRTHPLLSRWFYDQTPGTFVSKTKKNVTFSV